MFLDHLCPSHFWQSFKGVVDRMLHYGVYLHKYLLPMWFLLYFYKLLCAF